MCSDTTIFFTHIPKTSGTSFKETLLNPNIPDSATFKYRDKRQWMNDIGSYKIFTGHFKFGLHNFFRRKPRYITFLREPLDRAVSHYYFIKDCDPKKYLHPLRKIADTLSLEEFYSKNVRLQNLQTNFKIFEQVPKTSKNFPKTSKKPSKKLPKTPKSSSNFAICLKKIAPGANQT